MDPFDGLEPIDADRRRQMMMVIENVLVMSEEIVAKKAVAARDGEGRSGEIFDEGEE